MHYTQEDNDGLKQYLEMNVPFRMPPRHNPFTIMASCHTNIYLIIFSRLLVLLSDVWMLLLVWSIRVNK